MLSLCVPSSTRTESNSRIQWDYIFGSWNIDKIYFINDGQVLNDEDSMFLRDKEVISILNYSEIVEKIVLISPLDSQGTKGEINLKDYTHPIDCCYLFGSNNSSINTSLNCDKVYIDTLLHLFSWTSAGITLYDRTCKNGN